MDVDLKQVDKGKVRSFFNFDTMLLPTLVKAIFVVGLCLLVLAALIQPFVSAFGVSTVFEGGHLKESLSFNFGRFLWGVVVSAIMLVLGTLWLRIVCESMIILFKIHEALVPKKPIDSAQGKPFDSAQGKPAEAPAPAAPEKPSVPPA